jgi:hypothetical protein
MALESYLTITFVIAPISSMLSRNMKSLCNEHHKVITKHTSPYSKYLVDSIHP